MWLCFVWADGAMPKRKSKDSHSQHCNRAGFLHIQWCCSSYSRSLPLNFVFIQLSSGLAPTRSAIVQAVTTAQALQMSKVRALKYTFPWKASICPSVFRHNHKFCQVFSRWQNRLGRTVSRENCKKLVIRGKSVNNSLAHDYPWTVAYDNP